MGIATILADMVTAIRAARDAEAIGNQEGVEEALIDAYRALDEYDELVEERSQRS